MYDFWYPYRIIGDYAVPDDTREVVQSAVRPPGLWWGPFHCERCAIDCGSFGMTEETAFVSNHDPDIDKRVWATGTDGIGG